MLWRNSPNSGECIRNKYNMNIHTYENTEKKPSIHNCTCVITPVCFSKLGVCCQLHTGANELHKDHKFHEVVFCHGPIMQTLIFCMYIHSLSVVVPFCANDTSHCDHLSQSGTYTNAVQLQKCICCQW